MDDCKIRLFIFFISGGETKFLIVKVKRDEKRPQIKKIENTFEGLIPERKNTFISLFFNISERINIEERIVIIGEI